MRTIIIVLIVALILSCGKNSKNNGGLLKHSERLLTKEQALKTASEIESSISPVLAPGLKMKLWASDSLAPDPVALFMDDNGAAYITRTVRQKNSEFDIRGYEHWKTSSISWKSVEDRRKFLREYFSPKDSKKNNWLRDLNNDGSHDWKDLAVEKEEIYKIEDKDNDGIADKATRYVIDIVEEVTDIAAGLLVRAKDMFLTMAPDLWRFEDTNGDGEYDKKTSISSGYAIHVGFSGHNMSGPIEGPDGRIYFNMGDIGSNITDINGNKYDNSQSGMIGRCNPDGSDFEIFATGLRNTHEFAFDDYGNFISCDNDGDFPGGERERLVHIIQGSDAGWRAHWQYGKYSDPKNNNYNVWMDERYSVPRWDSQAAFILPPIQSFHNGPTGMIYNPGTALGKNWLNKFFVVEFVGDMVNSKVWAFGLKPSGAGFVLDKDEVVVSGIVPTGIQFGPDGALYVADWVLGWETKDYGRIWKVDLEKQDMENERKRTKELMTYDYSKAPIDTLANLLGYSDRRIRMKSQFALVSRGNEGLNALANSTNKGNSQFKRIHAIWGLGQLMRNDKKLGRLLEPLLDDDDIEIQVQAAKVLGDAKVVDFEDKLIKKLSSNNDRLVFHLIEALGRIQSKKAIQPIFDVITRYNDKDIYIRHAAAHALFKIGDFEKLVSNSKTNNKALKLTSIVALRKAKHPGLKEFLNDKDILVVTEAARAINDDGGIKEAMPALADIITTNEMKYEPLARRIINACLISARPQDLTNLYAYANNPTANTKFREEAFAALATWHNPSEMDRVDGRHIGKILRDSTAIRKMIIGDLNKLYANTNPRILNAITKMVVGQKIDKAIPIISNIFNTNKDAEVRSVFLVALDKLNYPKISELVKTSINDSSPILRTAAISLIKEEKIDPNYLKDLAEVVFSKGTKSEQQQMLSLIKKFKKENTFNTVKNLIETYNNGKLTKEVELEFFEALDSMKSNELSSMVKRNKNDELAEYREALYGGDFWPGFATFFFNSKAQCGKCHRINGEGSNVGPDLSQIGKVLSREEILASIITPSAKLAKGYGTMTANTKDGRKIVGVVLDETPTKFIIKTSDAEPLHLKKSDVLNTEYYPSAMPPFGKKLKKSELRDIIEFLANLPRKDS